MTTKTEINLKPFCCKDNRRYALGSPFFCGGWRYATDARVIVRVPATGVPDTDDGLKRPAAWQIFEPRADGVYVRWPDVSECEQCGNTGNVSCEGCKCGNCQEVGCGDVLCGGCTGRASIDHMFGETEISKHYAYLVSRLPNVEYLPTSQCDKPVRFRFDGGEGAVMGLQRGAP